MTPSNRTTGALLAALFVLALGGAARAQATVYAGGCSGSGGPPTLSHSGSLIPFTTSTITLSGAPPNGLIVLFLGLDNEDSEGNPIHTNLDHVGGMAPGCELNNTADLTFVLTADANGEFQLPWPVRLGFGPEMNFQFAVYESVSPLSIVMSEALELRIPLVVTPETDDVDLGTEVTGQTTPKTVVNLVNDTPVVRRVVNAVVLGAEASDFSSVLSSPAPVVLQPGQTTPLELDFTPTNIGPRGAQVQIVTDAKPASFPDAVIDVRGVGIGPPGDELRINAGASAPYVDSTSRFWPRDFAVSGGVEVALPDAVAGTADPALFQELRTGAAFAYSIPMPDARYEVTFHFAELEATAAAQRVFDVSLEGVVVIDDLDVFAVAGADTATSVSVTGDVTDGSLDIAFAGEVGDAMVAAIELRSIFPVLEVTPDDHDFGFLSLFADGTLHLTLENTGTDTLQLSTVGFVNHAGGGGDFGLDLDDVIYSGDDVDVVYPASLALAPGESIAARVVYEATEHITNIVDIVFDGNFDPVTLSLMGTGGSIGHPFLHVVIEPIPTAVDYEGAGTRDVVLDGTFSHTHEPDHSLTTFSWSDGQSNLASTDLAVVGFGLGSHTVCLTIEDDNVPPESLQGCAVFDVVPPTAVPGVLAHYTSTGGSNPATFLDSPPADPDWVEVLGAPRVDGQGSVGGSGLSSNVLVRLFATIEISTADTYELAATGGTDQRLFVNGSSYTAPLALGVGFHTLEARFSVDGVADLPLEVLMAASGETLAPIPGSSLTHDETVDPPVINSMTDAGSTLGGNLVVIDGFGFFPSGSLVVQWGSQTLTAGDFDSLSATQITFSAPPHSAGVIAVSVTSAQGVSNSRTFTYSDNGPVPIVFTHLSNLVSLYKPVCGEWGPDGRFYVAQLGGGVQALTFDEDYNVTAQQLYPGVDALQNDDILGIAFNPFDPPDPVKIYVAHAELFAQGGGAFTGPAPFSGQVSVLTGPSFDVPEPLITGLPVSNHDHAVNGMVFDNNGDLLMAVGGNTNAGVIHPNIGDIPESPLSAAIVKARTSRADFDGAVTYEDRVTGAPIDDQVLGEDAVVSGGHVAPHAFGLRNSFDVALTTAGDLWATDNGPNNGFGYKSTGPDTDSGTHAQTADELLLVEAGNYYGHPNRARGHDDSRQNVYRGLGPPSIPGVFSQQRHIMSASTNGIDEYRATTFLNAMRGNLVTQRWNGVTSRVELTPDGRNIELYESLSPTTGALSVATGPGGAIVCVDYGASSLDVLVPSDSAAVGLTAYDIFPWRAPATGGVPFVIGGENFTTLPDTTVTIGGIPATLTSVTSKRIEGLLPAQSSPTTDMLDVVVTTSTEQSTIPAAFRALFVPAGSEPGRWRDFPDLPVPLGEVAAGVIDGVLYVFGEGSSVTATYDLMDEFGGTWSTTDAAPRPYPGHHHAAEVYNGKLYVIGGLTGGAAGKVQIYDPDTDSWSLGTDMPWAAGSCCTALIGDTIYVSGGIVGSMTVTNTAAYHPDTDTWTTGLAPMIDGRNHSAVGTDGSKMYVLGGRGPGSGDANVLANGFGDIQVYDPVADTWESSNDVGSTLAAMPIGRGGTGKAVYWGGELYVFGGETINGPGYHPGGVYFRVDVYDPADNTWRQDADMMTRRHGGFPVLFESKIYLVGGGKNAGNAQAVEAEVFTRQ